MVQRILHSSFLRKADLEVGRIEGKSKLDGRSIELSCNQVMAFERRRLIPRFVNRRASNLRRTGGFSPSIKIGSKARVLSMIASSWNEASRGTGELSRESTHATWDVTMQDRWQEPVKRGQSLHPWHFSFFKSRIKKYRLKREMMAWNLWFEIYLKLFVSLKRETILGWLVNILKGIVDVEKVIEMNNWIISLIV